MATVGIVIVNYNGKEYQNECIRSLYAMEYQDFEIIVVDSASSDDSVEMLRTEFPKVHILEQKENVGVAVGNNIGICYSKKLGTKYTLLMNNDVELDTKMLSELIKKAIGKTVVVPKIYYYEPSNLLWFAGGELVWNRGSAIHIGIHEEDKGQYDDERYITYAPTCCMLIPNEVFERIGMIDEQVFMYYDDTDFCARMQEHNIPLLYVPSSKMWHKVSSASGGENSRTNVYYMFRNQLYYIKKHKKMMKFSGKLYAIIRGIAKYILHPICCKNDKYILDAYIDYARNKMGRKDF